MKHQSVEIEAWIVGGVMALNGAGDPLPELLAAVSLTEDDFATGSLRAAFGALRVLSDRGRPGDPEAVWTLLRGTEAGSKLTAGRLAQLAGNSNAVAVATLKAHADELRRLAKLRRLEQFHREQLEHLGGLRPDPVQLGSAVNRFASEFSAVTEGDGTGEQDVLELAEDWEAFISGRREPLMATGIEALDEEIGGFVPNLNVIGGLPSVGKSALAAEIISNCLGRGLKVGVFGLEDGTKWIPKRLAAREAGIPVGRFGACRLNEFQQEKLQSALGRVSARVANLVTYKRAGVDLASLIQRAKQWVVTRGVQAIWIDHAGEIQHERHGRDDYRLAVTETYRQLRDFAVNFRTPVIVLSHFNRATEQAGPPRMSSFAEAAGIERMARLALGLWESEDRQLRCTILKRTEGRRDVTLWLDRDEQYALVSSKGGGVLDMRQTQPKEQKRLWSEGVA